MVKNLIEDKVCDEARNILGPADNGKEIAGARQVTTFARLRFLEIAPRPMNGIIFFNDYNIKRFLAKNSKGWMR